MSCVSEGVARIPLHPRPPPPPPHPKLPDLAGRVCTGFGLAVTPFGRKITMLGAIPKCYLFPFWDTTQRKETNPIALHVECCVWPARVIYLVPGLGSAWVGERVIVAGPDPPTALPVHVSVVGQLIPLLVRSPLSWRGNNACLHTGDKAILGDVLVRKQAFADHATQIASLHNRSSCL